MLHQAMTEIIDILGASALVLIPLVVTLAAHAKREEKPAKPPNGWKRPVHCKFVGEYPCDRGM